MIIDGEKATPLLCLDLDGTVRHGLDELGRFVNGPEDVVVFPEAVEMMRRWKAGGGRIMAVSNQGGIALGHMSGVDCANAMLRSGSNAGTWPSCCGSSASTSPKSLNSAPRTEVRSAGDDRPPHQRHHEDRHARRPAHHGADDRRGL